ncbi:hypothetical protein H0O03_03150 [Candidatus Micrarchaeota archaeon]|nr:hypothetical protein [Candidatus Micrarchaeota archaeon]
MQEKEVLDEASKHDLVVARAALQKLLQCENASEVLAKAIEAASGPVITLALVEEVEESVESANKAKQITVFHGTEYKPPAAEVGSQLKMLEDRDVTGKSRCTGSVEDFANCFRDRFRRISSILKGRVSQNGVTKISTVKNLASGRQSRIIGMVCERRETKNGHVIIELEDEEDSVPVLVARDSPIKAKSEEVILDEVIAVDGAMSGSLFIAKEITWPEMPFAKPKLVEDDVSIAFVSDTHVGSKLFMQDQFQRFLNFINGNGTREEQEIAGKIKYLAFAGDACVTPETKIFCDSAVKPIKEVSVGDRVLTHCGKYRTVTKEYVRKYDGDVLAIKIKNSNEILTLTPEHPVLAVRSKPCKYYPKKTTCSSQCLRQAYASYHRPCPYNYYEKYSLEWIPAKELTEKDFVAFPVPNDVRDLTEVNLEKYVEAGSYSFERGGLRLKNDRLGIVVPKKIKFSKEFARLVGYYLAEGSTKYVKKRGTVSLAFNKKEEDYIQDVERLFKKLFHVNAKRNVRENCCAVYVHSKIVAAYFKHFGASAEKKQMPHEFLFLPLEKQAELLKGLWRGDGCRKKQVYALSCTSVPLVYQTKILLARLGMVPLVYEIKTQGKRGLRKNPLYNVEVCGTDLPKMDAILKAGKHPFAEKRVFRVRQHVWKHGNLLLQPVRKIEKRHYSGNVHNLKVAGDNSYTTATMVVHNCDGIGVYPSQEKELVTKDIYTQYEIFGEFIKRIPEHIEVIIIPGNHDAVRLAEPQPALLPELVKNLSGLKNIHLTSNPGWAEVHGLKLLMYHGAGIHSLVGSLPILRGAYEAPEKAAVEMLRRRHLDPIYGEEPLAPEQRDYLVIDEPPDFLHFGDLHKNGYGTYRGTLIVNSGCWQSRTEYQIKKGHHPTPCLLPLYNMKTGNLRVLDFNAEKITGT